MQTDRGAYTRGDGNPRRGPWLPSLLDAAYCAALCRLPPGALLVRREGGIEPYLPGAFPIFIWVRDDGDIYGFPAIDGPGGGVKVATEVYDETTSADAVRARSGPQEAAGDVPAARRRARSPA